jgi:hypothetical protein
MKKIMRLVFVIVFALIVGGCTKTDSSLRSSIISEFDLGVSGGNVGYTNSLAQSIRNRSGLTNSVLISRDYEFSFFRDSAAVVKIWCRVVNQKNPIGCFVCEEYLYSVGMKSPFMIQSTVIDGKEKKVVSKWEDPILYQ